MNFIEKFKYYLREQKYSIGFIENYNFDLDNYNFDKIRWMDENHYKNGWFADPFIYRITEDEIHVLAEEFEYHNGKGRLVYLKIQKDGFKLREVIPILELSTHLSFPIYIREENKTYIYPENYQNGSLIIYEFDEKTLKLINPRVLINEPMLDTQILKKNNNYYAMGVIFDDGGDNSTRRLRIYVSHSLFGPYQLVQNINNHKKEERGAGEFIIDKKNIIRPAQSCEDRYGKEVILYGLNWKNNEIIETEIKRIRPNTKKKNGLSLHTFNISNNYLVVDGTEYRHYYPGRLIAKIMDILQYKK